MISGTIEYWNGEAGKRWAASQQQLDMVLEPFGKALIEAAQLPTEGVVVDVGCGCGATTLMAAGHSTALTTTGIDVSRPMLEVARKRATELGLSTRFEEADASTFSFGDGYVDRVISRFGVMFFEEPPAAFANIRRWLAPTGRLSMTVWDPIEKNAWATMLVEVVSRHVDLPTPPSDGPGPFSLGDEAALERTLESAGFAKINQTALDLPMRVPGSLEEVFGFFLDRGPVLAALAEADEATGQALVQDVRAFVAERHDGKGVTLPAAARLVCAQADG